MTQPCSPVLVTQEDSSPPGNVEPGRNPHEANAASSFTPPSGDAQPQWPMPYQEVYSPTSSPPAQQNVRVSTNRYADPNDIPVNLTAIKYRHRPWHYSLCVSCKEMDSCAESCCCLYCQVSRQCNMLVSNKHKIHWPYCLLMAFTDLCTLHMIVTWVFVSETRRLARDRYGIGGSCFSDCCVGCWCRSCSTQQVLLEMTVMNDFPGATCYNAVPQPMNFEMV
ncbi:putative ama1 protein [Leptomonas seymouri]|uniref:Putative ama1 protein n=1 Tax=Leptomonas seymouri TaxID=5684 RepID=A0A0N1I1Y6_LEPSE|nr:putative ama1 protein [Leptomonas seymouri]|eukprot:KPI90381.1 putative ama1 protein [Leptomonas seymouri]